MNSPRNLVGGLVTVFTTDGPAQKALFSMLAEWQPTFPPSRPEVRVLLQLPEASISSQTRSALNLIDSDDCPEPILSLLRGVRAYLDLQDVLDRASATYEGKPRFQTDHCYYESIVYLRESLSSWIQGNEVAAIALLRPFMELSLMNLYWRQRSRTDRFEPFFKWLDGTAGKPPFKQIREFVTQHIPTQDLLDSQDLEGFCAFFADTFDIISSYNHTPKPEQSLFLREGLTGDPAKGEFGLYVPIAKALLQHLVLLYVFSYPAVLFPVDRKSKFGYGYGPVGLLADQSTANILHDFLGDSFEKLRLQFGSFQQVRDLQSFFDAQPNLSPDEIEASWDGNPEFDATIKAIKNSDARQSIVKAHVRSLGWMMSYRSVSTKADAKLDGFLARAQSGFTHLRCVSDLTSGT